jgi:hypothetical protein
MEGYPYDGRVSINNRLPVCNESTSIDAAHQKHISTDLSRPVSFHRETKVLRFQIEDQN